MKKNILSTILCGSVLLVGTTIATNVQAADVLSGDTAVTSEVIAGDVTLEIGASLDFGTQSLAPTVDFGTQDLDYKISDYSGTTVGYTLTAKTDADDTTRSLKIDDKELSTTDAEIINEATSTGAQETADKFTTGLIYTGLTEAGTKDTTITWTLTKGTIRQIAE
ncbi:hypothetical protein VNN36_12120 (plasmid) [Lactococcus garvieae]|uniref:hypothetical protein n=1 Tax=Lactococcus garvieae TaxID=1363 RepID=UPI0030CF2B30